jgi:hypothetical protein
MTRYRRARHACLHVAAQQLPTLKTALFPATVASYENLANIRSWVHGDVNSFSGGLRGAIVCSTNARADEHNLALLDIVHGEEKVYFGRDEVVPVRDGDQLFESWQISAEASRAFTDSSIPPAELHLKVRFPTLISYLFFIYNM